MKALSVAILGSVVFAVACSSDPAAGVDAGKDSSSSDGSSTDGSSTNDAAVTDGTVTDGGGGPSIDSKNPTPLTVGTPVSGTLQPDGTPVPPDFLPKPGSMHFFSFTVPTTGRYTVTVQGSIQGGHCTTASPSGCLCQQGPLYTCCMPGDAASCNYTCEKAKGVDWTQGTVIYPYAYNQGPGVKSYTMTITGPI